MGITFDNTRVVKENGAFSIFPRDGNDKPAAIIAGLDPNGNYKLGQFTSDGKLKVDAYVDASGIDIGDVNIRVKDILGNDLLVAGATLEGSTFGFLYAEDPRMGFTGGNLLVSVAGTTLAPNAATEATLQDILEVLGGGSLDEKVSRFDYEFVAPSQATPTILLDYVVPNDSRFRISSVRAWADVDAEYGVYIDSIQVDGYRTTPANLTMDINSMSVQYATAGQHITIAATHWVDRAGTQVIKAALQGALESI